MKQTPSVGSVNKSSFDVLASLAHDLKTPLINNLATASLLKDGYVAHEDMQEQFERLHISSTQMVDMIDAILLAGRVQTSQTALDLSPVNPTAVMKEVEKELRPLSARLGCDITIRSRGRLSPVYAHHNALKYSLKCISDSIMKSSRSEVIDVLLHQRKNQVMITLKDDGQHFSNATIKRMLERMGTSVQPSKALPASSGVSVYLAVVLTEAMHGSFQAYTNKGKRSLSFAFPITNQLELF